jgi:tetratricopeptide (TPR) repeat protein
MRNAIERRLDRLAELWEYFAADPNLRLLRWRGVLDDLRMVDLFIDLQSEEIGTAPDVFLRLQSPFEDAASYGRALADDLLAQHDAAKAELEARGVSADWHPPEPSSGESEEAFLLRAAASLQAHYPERMQCLVLVLAPAAVADDRAFAAWLVNLLGLGVPPALRLVVTDPAEAPRLEGLDETAPEFAVTIDPALDMPGALDELARSEGEEGPAKLFRIHLVSLANAAGKGNLEAAKLAAGRALEVAKKEDWPDQALVAHMALGAAYLGRDRPEDAVGCYRQAAVAAEAAAAKDHPAVHKLRLTAAMGEGAALLAAACWGEAVAAYERAAPLAEAAADPFMLLEAWRMAGWCHEQAGSDRDAWRCGQRALDAGRALPEEQRARSTLPWVGQMLLRLVERNYRDRRYAQETRRRLSSLLGPVWEQIPPPGVPAP